MNNRHRPPTILLTINQVLSHLEVKPLPTHLQFPMLKQIEEICTNFGYEITELKVNKEPSQPPPQSATSDPQT